MRYLMILVLIWVGAVSVAQEYATEEPLASPLVDRLNVRSVPSLEDEVQIIGVLDYGDIVPVVGRLPDHSWYEVIFRGVRGWVVAELVIITNPDRVPLTGTDERASYVARVTNNPNVPPANGVRTRDNLNVRAQPALSGALLDVLPADTQAVAVARDEFGLWYLVTYEDGLGWVSSRYLDPLSTFDIRRLPVP